MALPCLLPRMMVAGRDLWMIHEVGVLLRDLSAGWLEGERVGVLFLSLLTRPVGKPF